MAMTFTEQNGLDYFKFDRDGVELAGVLVGFDRKEIKVIEDDKEIMRLADVCTVVEVDLDTERPTGREYEFIRSADLQKRLREDNIGHVVVVKRTGTMRVANGTMVTFLVKVSAEKYSEVTPKGTAKRGRPAKDAAPAPAPAPAPENIHGQEITGEDIPF